MINQVLSKVREIKDFPIKGIVFKDLTPVLSDPISFNYLNDAMAKKFKGHGITKVCGIESRGFITGAILADSIGAGFVPIRKPGKLPYKTVSVFYEKEYGIDTIEMHADAITEDDIVLIHDDLLATGGTMEAAYKLVKSMNPKEIYISFLWEIPELNGRSRLPQENLDILFSV